MFLLLHFCCFKENTPTAGNFTDDVIVTVTTPILPPLRPTVKCQTLTRKISALNPSRGNNTRLSLPQAVRPVLWARFQAVTPYTFQYSSASR